MVERNTLTGSKRHVISSATPGVAKLPRLVHEEIEEPRKQPVTVCHLFCTCKMIAAFAQVSIHDKHRMHTLIMTPSRQDDVKSLARGSWHAIVNRNMKIPERRDYIIACVGMVLIKQFCVKGHSILAGSGYHSEQLKSFKWSSVIKHAKKYMPVLLKLLRKCLQTPKLKERK